MDEFLRSGRIVDLIIGFMIIETAALFAYRRVSGRGIATTGLFANMAAGGCLLLALRAALAGSDWTWIPLAAALPLHLLDIRARWDV